MRAALATVTVADLLRAAWPQHTAKQAARAADGSVRTAEAWVAGRCSPSADTLLRMARRNDQLAAQLAAALTGAGNAIGLAPLGASALGADRAVAGNGVGEACRMGEACHGA